MRPFLARLARSETGVATIELALTTPILMALLVGVADMSLAYGRKLEIEQAAQRSIEMIQQTTEELTVSAAIKAEAADQGDVELDQVTVTHETYCDGTFTGNEETDCAEGAAETRYILVAITDEHEPVFPLKWTGITNDNGNLRVAAKAGIRTQ